MKKFIFGILFVLGFLTFTTQNTAQAQESREGSVHIWISEIGADNDGVGFLAYDFDTNTARNINTGFQGTYKTVDLGEYEYTRENLKALHQFRWTVDFTWLNWNESNIATITRSYDPQYDETPLSVEEFRNYYGSWFSLLGSVVAYRLPRLCVFRDQKDGNEVEGWGLPSIEDIMQLIGQAPRSSQGINHDILNYVAAGAADTPEGHVTEWMNYNNTSGLTLTPLGSREPYTGNLATYFYAFKKLSKLRLKEGSESFTFYAPGSYYSPSDYHYAQVRYCRAKTDEELGYKIYVDKCKDAVVILDYGVETNMPELPKGLERGIALKYADIAGKTVNRSWSAIELEAAEYRNAIQNLPAAPELDFPECEPEIGEAPDELDLSFKLILNVKGFYYEDKPGSDILYTTDPTNTPPGVEPIYDLQPIMKTKANRIGEYYWTDVFDLKVPHFAWWASNVGSMERYPLNDDYFNMYLLQCHIDYAQMSPDIADFDKYYGKYYDRFTLDNYMNSYGVMFEKNTIDVNDDLLPHMTNLDPVRELVGPGWGLPYMKDYRQLMAMAPFFNGTGPVLDEIDVRMAFSARPGDNPLAYNISNGTPLATYWFTESNRNLYNFNMMPTGVRLHAADAYWTNGLYSATNVLEGTVWENVCKRTVLNPGTGYEIDQWMGPKGAFALMFYTVVHAGRDGQLTIHDRVDTGSPTSYSAMTIRWCRKLTDRELGYKLFAKVNNISTTSNEWLSFVAGDELPLLKEVKKGNYQRKDFDIVKIDDPYAEAPAGYVELPNGYLRGFYVHYFITEPESQKTIEDIVLYAISVDDDALDIPGRAGSVAKAAETVGISRTVPTDSAIQVHPNPVTHTLYIDTLEKINRITVMSLTGENVKSIPGNFTSIDVSDITPGTYLVKVETESGTYTNKFIKR